MQAWKENKSKNACQIQFDDDDGDIPYRSLYLDTLGEEARYGWSQCSLMQQQLPCPVQVYGHRQLIPILSE
jgi:hypothetical protein